MSAYIVSKADIDALVYIRSFVQPHATYESSRDDAMLGAMLWEENAASLTKARIKR